MKGNKAKIFKNIGIAVICLCILSYSVFHVSSFFSEEIGTISVGSTTEKQVVSVSGYIFRDATPIYSEEYSGAIDYFVKNGEKVAVKDELAEVYADGNSSGEGSLVAVLDEQIDLLRKSVDKKPSVSSLNTIRQSASSAYYAIMSQLSEGRGLSISAEQKKLLTSLNSIAMLTEEEFLIGETLDKLLALRTELLAAGGDSEKVYSEKSGYFYTSVDGYEGAFTSEAATTLDRESLLLLLDAPEENRKTYDKNCIGKMSYDAVWYYVAEISAKDASNFAVGDRYTVEFTGGGHFEIGMDVLRVLIDEGEERAVIVFVSDILPEGFNFRMQTANIVTSTVSGIYVPRSAVHRERFSRVVYILKGSVVKLRHIDIVYEGSDYYLVRENVETEKDDDRVFLTSNEQLIVRGSGLFDGRILG